MTSTTQTCFFSYLNKVMDIISFEKHFLNFTTDSISLKTFLQQGISEPIFYGDLVYKFKRIVGIPNFSDKFKKDNQTL